MLLELKIKNIALIESLRIKFAQGFNVLTGETGAGKSIVVDSVNLALGGRADRELIRTGTDKAWVEAVFDAGDITLDGELLEEFPPEDGVYTVYKVLESGALQAVDAVMDLCEEVCSGADDEPSQKDK